jgi:hypothetical protein
VDSADFPDWTDRASTGRDRDFWSVRSVIIVTIIMIADFDFRGIIIRVPFMLLSFWKNPGRIPV